MGKRALIVKPTFFAPIAPPIGPSLLKSHAEQQGHHVTVVDFNTVPELWNVHHNYFDVIMKVNGLKAQEHGYSRFWWVLSLHCLAIFNNATIEQCEDLLKKILPIYGFRYHQELSSLNTIVSEYFRALTQKISQLDLNQYDFVGASSYTTSLASSLLLLRSAKQTKPAITTAIGGGIFSSDFNPNGQNFQQMLEAYPFIDHCVIGEGENNFLRILEGDAKNEKVLTIQNTPELLVNLEKAQKPDFSDLNVSSQYMNLAIESSRSCPYQCSFCSETLYWGKYRRKDAYIVAQEMSSSAKEFGKRNFFFSDSVINPQLTSLAEAIIRQNSSISYDGYLRADKSATSPERVELWARSGFSRARIGAESASQRVLDVMVKKTTPKTMARVIELLSKNNIKPTTYWIVGHPEETEEEFCETLRFIEQYADYIYEIEPHPYETYEVGQLNTERYPSEPLLPPEVMQLVNFQIWETTGMPSRSTRFERLERFVALTTRLGIPNIYTMKDWVQAEKRWATT